MKCAACPLSLVCLGGFVRVSHCSHCQRVIIALPPRLEQKGTYQVDPDRDEFKLISFPKTVVEYFVAQCDDLDMLPEVRNRMTDCPACNPDSVHNSVVMRRISGITGLGE